MVMLRFTLFYCSTVLLWCAIILQILCHHGISTIVLIFLTLVFLQQCTNPVLPSITLEHELLSRFFTKVFRAFSAQLVLCLFVARWCSSVCFLWYLLNWSNLSLSWYQFKDFEFTATFWYSPCCLVATAQAVSLWFSYFVAPLVSTRCLCAALSPCGGPLLSFLATFSVVWLPSAICYSRTG